MDFSYQSMMPSADNMLGAGTPKLPTQIGSPSTFDTDEKTKQMMALAAALRQGGLGGQQQQQRPQQPSGVRVQSVTNPTVDTAAIGGAIGSLFK